LIVTAVSKNEKLFCDYPIKTYSIFQHHMNIFFPLQGPKAEYEYRPSDKRPIPGQPDPVTPGDSKGELNSSTLFRTRSIYLYGILTSVSNVQKHHCRTLLKLSARQKQKTNTFLNAA